MNHYRVTMPHMYVNGMTPDDLGNRQGHYCDAFSVDHARQVIALRLIKDERIEDAAHQAEFDVQLWRFEEGEPFRQTADMIKSLRFLAHQPGNNAEFQVLLHTTIMNLAQLLKYM